MPKEASKPLTVVKSQHKYFTSVLGMLHYNLQIRDSSQETAASESMHSFPQMTQLSKILFIIQKLYHTLPLNIESNANTVLEKFKRFCQI